MAAMVDHNSLRNDLFQGHFSLEPILKWLQKTARNRRTRLLKRSSCFCFYFIVNFQYDMVRYYTIVQTAWQRQTYGIWKKLLSHNPMWSMGRMLWLENAVRFLTVPLRERYGISDLRQLDCLCNNPQQVCDLYHSCCCPPVECPCRGPGMRERFLFHDVIISLWLTASAAARLTPMAARYNQGSDISGGTGTLR